MIKVYQYECNTWSDGEDHDEDEHNSYYDFEYLVVEEKENITFIITIPYCIMMQASSSELQTNNVVREISTVQALSYLQAYLNRPYDSKYTSIAANAMLSLTNTC